MFIEEKLGGRDHSLVRWSLCDSIDCWIITSSGGYVKDDNENTEGSSNPDSKKLYIINYDVE